MTDTTTPPTTPAPVPALTSVTPPPAKTETTESRLSDLEFEFACMRRALISLGSAVMSGGPPGALPYIAWNQDEMAKNPIPRPAAAAPSWAKLREDGPTLEEFVKAGYSAADYPPPGYAAKPVTTSAEIAAATPLPANVAAPVSGEPMPDSLPAAPVGQPAPMTPIGGKVA